MSRSRYRFDDSQAPFFLTCTIVGWLPVLSRPEAARIVLDSWLFLQEKRRIKLYGYVIMENHLHFVASAEDLSKEGGDFKSYTARRIVDFLEQRQDYTLLGWLHGLKAQHKGDREYQVWQEGSHPEKILDEEMMRQKLEYTHNNPVRRDYVDWPEHWRYSSARNYSGLEGLIPVTTIW